MPFKGARDLEKWCRAHPDYLDELKLSERAHASLKLLEASGKPQDLGEPKPPWWKSIYLLIGFGGGRLRVSGGRLVPGREVLIAAR